MSIKGLFNNSEKNNNIHILKQKIDALEEQIKKITTIEVHLKRFLKIESDLQKEILHYNKKAISQPTNQRSQNKVFSDQELENKIIFKLNKYFSPEISKLKQMIDKEISLLKQIIDNEISSLKQMIESLENRFNLIEKEYLIIKQQTEENEKNIMNLEKTLSEAMSQTKNEQQPIVIQEINVEKILLDKYEQTNNFGQLGVKEISGQLNIGATYGKGVIPADFVEDLREDFATLKEQSEQPADQEYTDDDENIVSDKESTPKEHDDNFEDIPIE
ncbi:hypothetical protein J6TS2_13430 [Heyndrickxia sporothermodurans]|nr:hypothetical protein J6TS2_13430 [Heyndrickxia sporothermodurans]